MRHQWYVSVEHLAETWPSPSLVLGSWIYKKAVQSAIFSLLFSTVMSKTVPPFLKQGSQGSDVLRLFSCRVSSNLTLYLKKFDKTVTNRVRRLAPQILSSEISASEVTRPKRLFRFSSVYKSTRNLFCNMKLKWTLSMNYGDISTWFETTQSASSKFIQILNSRYQNATQTPPENL